MPEDSVQGQQRVASHLQWDEPPSYRFEDVRGLEAKKDRLRETVIANAENGDFEAFSTTSAAVFGDEKGGRRRLVQALVGELADCGLDVARAKSLSFGGYTCSECLFYIIEELSQSEPAVLLLECFADLDCSEVPFHEIGQAIESFREEGKEIAIVADLPTGSIYRGDVAELFRAFDVRISLGPPDLERRYAILEDEFDMAERAGAIAVDDSFDTYRLARQADGFGEAELQTVVRRVAQRKRACVSAGSTSKVGTAEALEVLERIDDERIESARAATAVEDIDSGDVSFDDVGGLSTAKERLSELLETPQQWSDAYDEFGLSTTGGILLHGPPGNGKTLLARAVANEFDRTFMSVSAPKLVNEYGHGVESSLQKIFKQAERNAPTVVFFDEFDSIAPERGDQPRKDDATSTLLTELDGIARTDGITVVAATNRPEVLDDAVLRPGRFEYLIPVSKPDAEETAEIFDIHTRELPLAGDVTPEWFVSTVEKQPSGAEIRSICEKAAVTRLERSPDESTISDILVRRSDFDRAVETVLKSRDYLRSLSEKDSAEAIPDGVSKDNQQNAD